MKNIQDSIAAIATAWERAWNQHDFTLFKGYLAKNVNWMGTPVDCWHGSKEILRVHAELHKEQWQFTRWRTANISCESTAPGVVLAYIDWVFEHLNQADEVISSREGLFTWMLVKKTNQWLIASCQAENLFI